MKLLFFNFGSYTLVDFLEALDCMRIDYDLVRYSFADKNHDDFFVHRFTKCLNAEKYDAVYSTNYFPLVAECCKEIGIKYISWSYDNPLNVPDIERTLGYETNYVFLFDKVQVNGFLEKGYKNVFHLPLAVNTSRLDKISITSQDKAYYSSDISFVGKLYDSNLGLYMSAMNDYEKGYIEAAINYQMQLYGCYLLDDIINESFMDRVNKSYEKNMGSTPLALTKEALIYAVGAEITRRERLTILHILGNHHDVKLYSREENKLLENVRYMGSCRYLDEMPKVFNLSKINLNINLKISQSGIPLRALDVMGAKGFLISSYQPEIAEYFEDGEEVVLYSSIEDAIEKVEYYLKNDSERERIAQKGYEKVKTHFNYENRISEMLRIVGLKQ